MNKFISFTEKCTVLCLLLGIVVFSFFLLHFLAAGQCCRKDSFTRSSYVFCFQICFEWILPYSAIWGILLLIINSKLFLWWMVIFMLHTYLAMQLCKKGIKVTIVCPGPISTTKTSEGSLPGQNSSTEVINSCIWFIKCYDFLTNKIAFSKKITISLIHF